MEISEVIATSLDFIKLNWSYFVYLFLFIFIFNKIKNLVYKILQIRKEKYKQNAGDSYEKFVGKYYEKQNFKVEYRGLELRLLDGGIDLIATKGEELLLIQCKNWSGKNRFDHKIIKEFYGNCHFYLDKNPKLKNKKLTCIFAIPRKSLLNTSAIMVFSNNAKINICRYEIISYFKKENNLYLTNTR